MRGVAAVPYEQLDLLERARAALAVGEDRAARAPLGDGGGLEDARVARRRPAGGARDLHDARPVGRALDDGRGVVELVDAVLDVGREEVRELVRGEAHRPVAVVVVALVVEPRRGDDVDAAAARDLGQEEHVAAAVGGHGIDDRAQAEGLGGRQLGDRLVHVGELEVGEELDRPTAVDDEVLVGVDDAELVGRDIAEDGSGEAHGISFRAVSRPARRGRADSARPTA